MGMMKLCPTLTAVSTKALLLPVPLLLARPLPLPEVTTMKTPMLVPAWPAKLLSPLPVSMVNFALLPALRLLLARLMSPPAPPPPLSVCSRPADLRPRLNALWCASLRNGKVWLSVLGDVLTRPPASPSRALASALMIPDKRGVLLLNCKAFHFASNLVGLATRKAFSQ